MNRHVNAIAGRLSLLSPQRRSLEILDRITEIAPPKKGADVAVTLAAIESEFPQVTDFEYAGPEPGLLCDDQSIQRAPRSLENRAVTNMGSGRTTGRGYVDLTWVGLGSDPSLLLRISIWGQA